MAATAGAPLLRHFAGLAAVDSVPVYGPKQFGTPTGGTAHHVERFPVAVAPGARYALRVANGAAGGAARLDSARVVLNGTAVYSGADLRAAGPLSRPVIPLTSNTLEVTAHGPAGAYLTLELVQAPSSTYPVFQRYFDMAASTKTTEVHRFTIAATAAPPHRVRIENGNPDGSARASSAEVILNGTYVVVQNDLSQQVGLLEREVTLKPGENVVEVSIGSRPGGRLNFIITSTDATAPVLAIDAPATALITRAREVQAAGRVQDETATRVTVNGVTASRSGAAFSTVVPLATEGENRLAFSAVDAAGLRTDSVRTVIRDTEAPAITLAAPAEGAATRDSLVQVRGTIRDRTAVKANVNGVAVALDASGAFGATVPAAAEGANFLTVTATDAAGNSANLVRQVVRDTRAPSVAFTSPAEGSVTRAGSVAVAGTVADAGAVTVAVNGVAMTVENGAFRGEVPLQAEGKISLAAVARDVAGNEAQAARGIVRDATAPEIRVAAPDEGMLTRERTVQLRGTVADSTAVTLTLNGTAVALGADGSFAVDVPLAAEGRNALALAATDAAGNQAQLARTVVRDATVRDTTAVTLTVNGAPVAVGADGAFAATVALASEGDNALAVVAVDGAGNRAELTRAVVRDSEAPAVAVASPAEGSFTRAGSVTVTGTVSDRSAVQLRIAGVTAVVDATGAFTAEVPLAAEGGNTLGIEATDAAGNTAVLALTVRRDTEAPVVTIAAPQNGATTTEAQVAVSGSVRDAGSATVRINGTEVAVNADGTFVGEVALGVGANAITIQATDAAGNEAALTLGVTRGEVKSEPLPADPAKVAPKLDPTVATTMAAATSFLYSGNNPIQTGVAPGAIQMLRAAAVRGRVVDRAGQPLPGVTVSVLDHPELGQTLSRADGAYDLAVNGGSTLTLNFEKTSFIAAQRQAEVAWQDFTALEDVALVGLDPVVTAIDVSSADEVQIARGSAATDADGTRRATVLFDAGTQAVLELADGTTRPVSGLSIRATEYTVGENGTRAMPASLPATSAYTYAVELSADEAIAAGAEHVKFSKPVSFYVENFLGFPVGTPVPVGWYDREKAAWVPSENGRVIKILDVASGTAQVDADGDGAADLDAALNAMGIDDAERAKLARTYTAGQTLWHALMTHFSPWDLNYPGGPGGTDPEGDAEDDDSPDCENEQKGSIIECESQVLGERISLAGTGMSLNYRTARVPGRAVGRSVKVTLTGPTVAPDLIRVVLEVEVAGRKITQSFAPSANLTHRFVWDGKDAYGRMVQGTQTATVRIGHVYPFTYYVPASGARSFGLTCTGSVNASGFQACVIPSTISSSARQEGTRWREFKASVTSWDARNQGLGGWTLDVHHSYDPVARLLHRGDGSTQGAAPGLKTALRTAAGVGLTGFAGDGGPATQARIFGAEEMRTAPNGEIYIADYGNHRIRRIARNGVITTVAGGGTGGDGGPALGARLSYPHGIGFMKDGGLLIAEEGGQRIRRVAPDGTISTLAGTGVGGYSGDGGPATQARINTPRYVLQGVDGSIYFTEKTSHVVRRIMPDGSITTAAGTGVAGFGGDGGPAGRAQLNQPDGLALGADGSVYVSDQGNHRVRRIAPSGLITTVAGTGGLGFSGDNAAATLALLNRPQGLEVTPDGTIYIADSNNNRVRAVGPDGVITTVAGNGTAGYSTEGGAATGTKLNRPRGVMRGTDGALYVADFGNNRIRRIAPDFPGLADAESVVAAEDGSEAYVFDAHGRHLRTVSPSMSTNLHTFGYDEAGRLVSVRDQDGNTTRIERNTAGDAVAVLAPSGLRTRVTVDGSGVLTEIADPDGQSVRLGYGAGALLASLTDRKEETHRYTYDELGRLVRDENPAGGSKTLVRREDASGYEVSVTTAAGVTTTYRSETLSSGAERRIVTGPDGLRTTTVTGLDGRTTQTVSDGTVTTLSDGADPGWGLQVPRMAQMTMRTPGGLQVDLGVERQITLQQPGDPMSVTSRTVRTTLNGQTFTSSYDAALRRLTETTPEGRQASRRTDGFGRTVEITAPGALPINYTYDLQGRLSEAVQGARVWRYAYNAEGRLYRSTDPLGRVEEFHYDAMGRLQRQVLPDRREIGYGYDANGNLTRLTPPGRPAHSFAYTAGDQRVSYAPPSLGAAPLATQYRYDLDGRLARVVRADGAALEFGHDNAGRIAELAYAGGRYTYQYSTTTGRLAAVTAPDGGKLAYSYDGPLPLVLQWTGAVSGRVGLSYGRDLRVAAQTVNGADTVAFSYNRDGLLVGAGRLAFARDAQSGRVIRSTVGAVSAQQGYDSYGELSALSAAHGTAALFQAQYTRDPLGRITALRETLGGQSTEWSYGYDAQGHLTRVERDGAPYASYEYDDNGNRVSATTPGGVLAGVVDAQDRLVGYGDAAYRYTVAGELTHKAVGGDTTRYRHDALGNLVGVQLPGGTLLEYLIDGQQRRIGKRVDGVLVRGYLYAGPLSPVAELDGAGKVVSRFVYGGRGNVPEYMTRGGRTYAFVHDHLGSVRLVVDDATGAVAQRIDYDAWGKVVHDSNPGFQPFGFAGGMYEPQTGLTHFGAREYDAHAGRWISKDPLGFGGGDANLYGYSLGDPLNLVDPDGLQAIALPSMGTLSRAGAAAARVLPLAGAAAASDAVLPIGDVIGICIIGGAVLGSLLNEQPEPLAPEAREPVPPGSTGGPTAGRRATPRERDAARRRNAEAGGGVEHCVYCGIPTTREPGKPNSSEVDHVEPRNPPAGSGRPRGNNEPENLTNSCKACNGKKSNRPPGSWQ